MSILGQGPSANYIVVTRLQGWPLWEGLVWKSGWDLGESLLRVAPAQVGKGWEEMEEGQI